MTAELRALNARFINNFITNDVPGHDAILHRDFICITPTGARVSRADYLKAWATGFDAGRIPYYDYRDEKIDVFGDGVPIDRDINHANGYDYKDASMQQIEVHGPLCDQIKSGAIKDVTVTFRCIIL